MLIKHVPQTLWLFCCNFQFCAEQLARAHNAINFQLTENQDSLNKTYRGLLMLISVKSLGNDRLLESCKDSLLPVTRSDSVQTSLLVLLSTEC